VKTVYLIDTGPLVAFLNRRDRHHLWSVELLSGIEPPIETCESVLSEACFLLRASSPGPAAVLGLVTRGLLRVSLQIGDEATAIEKLMRKYSSVPMALADATLVRLSELRENSVLITLDRDFHVYRRHGRQAIPIRMPHQ
jgi:predicted nucleic acid-binding protein